MPLTLERRLGGQYSKWCTSKREGGMEVVGWEECVWNGRIIRRKEREGDTDWKGSEEGNGSL